MSRFDSYKDEEQSTNHTWTRVGLVTLFLIFGIALVWLSIKVSHQMHHFKTHLGTYIKRIIIGGIILTLIVGLTFIVLNSIGKKKSYDKHYVKDGAVDKHK